MSDKPVSATIELSLLEQIPPSDLPLDAVLSEDAQTAARRFLEVVLESNLGAVFPKGILRSDPWEHTLTREFFRRWATDAQVMAQLARQEGSSSSSSTGLEVRSPTGTPRLGERESSQLDRENADLRVQVEVLKTRLAEERRRAARETQRFDQQAAANDKLVDMLSARARANDSLQAALTAHNNGRQVMFEAYDGVVKHVDEESVVVVYQVEDDLTEQTYLRRQFLDGKLPKLGDRLAVYVHVAELPPDEKTQVSDTPPSTAEPRKHPKHVVTLPRTF